MPEEPRYFGGQAVMEGVMMRGAHTWAIAVRTPDGEVELDVREVPRWAERYRAIPLLRGVMNLGESMALGYRALMWSAERALPPDDDAALDPDPVGDADGRGAGGADEIPKGAIAGAMAFALVVFSGLFILVPAIGARLVADRVPGLPFAVAEGFLSLGLFLGYLLLIGRVPDVRRVFQYHGAEHKAIAAYENGVPVTAESAQRFTTEHVRCGTNFLLTVLVVAIVVYALIGELSWPALIVSRIVMIPVIAGFSYEVIRFAARHMDRPVVRLLMRPGLLLQRLTTREPTHDQVEVAIAALRAVMSAEQLAEIDRRTWPAGGFGRPALGPA